MNYKNAKEYLERVSKYGSKLGLDSIKALLMKMENPHKDLKVVHIAGTNGKGSIGAFIESILLEAGYKVGRYSSPAVFEYREIIQVNNTYISEEEVAEIIGMIKEKADMMVREGYSHPTPFEIETAMAFEYFKRSCCDIVLVECGLGGETDATNVFEKVLCSVLTPISLDHTGFLGNSIQEITDIKCGIIKERCNVVSSLQIAECMEKIRKNATKKNAKLVECNQPFDISIEGMVTTFKYKSNNKLYNIKSNLIGIHQITNAITAVEVCQVLKENGFHTEGYVGKGIENTKWLGRMEIISNQPLFFIDGAHNPGAVKILKENIDLYFTNKRIAFIMGVLADKDFENEARIIAGSAVKIFTVTPDNLRALDGRKLADTIKKYNSNVEYAQDIAKAVHLAIDTVKRHQADMIIAFGSLSYLAEIKQTVKAERRD